MSDDISIGIYCTDRGQHRRRDLYRLHTDGRRLYLTTLSHTGVGRAGEATPVDIGAYVTTGSSRGDAVTLACTKCPRNLRKHPQTLSMLVASGLTQVDLSALEVVLTA